MVKSLGVSPQSSGGKKEGRRKKQEKRGRKGESFLITNYPEII
ncbi:hypothetical protein [Okeania sp. SIO1I7]|nr:hypothetical protein [Okeania sp. SIO1I7]